MATIEIVTPGELEPLQSQVNDGAARLDVQAAQIDNHGDLLVSAFGMLGAHGDFIADLLTRVTALENGQPPQPIDPVIPDGLRGMWLQDANPSNYNVESVQAAAEFGANAIFIFAGTGRGTAFDNTVGIPRNSNSLELVIEEADRLDLDVYPALPSKYFWRAGYPEQDMRYTTNFVPDNDPWLDFRVADARLLMAHLCADLAKYPIVGICADYTRWSRYWYPDSGLTSAPVTATIEAMRQACDAGGVPLFASPISILDGGEYGACAGYGQCWPEWDGVAFFPMTYYGEYLETRIAEWGALFPMRAAPILSPVKWSGGSTEIPKTDEAFRLEFEQLWDAGGRGCAMFDLNTVQKYPDKAAILMEMW